MPPEQQDPLVPLRDVIGWSEFLVNAVARSDVGVNRARGRFVAVVVQSVSANGEVVDGTGDHADHRQRQHGEHVTCSCGLSAPGRLPDGVLERGPRWEVRVGGPDGDVVYTSRDQQRALDRAATRSASDGVHVHITRTREDLRWIHR